MNIILTGGGSGGHVYPALAFAETIKEKRADDKFLYLGKKGKLESYIVPKKGYQLKYIYARPLPARKLSFQFIIFAIVLGLGLLKSIFIHLSYKTDLIIATGGYVSGPSVMAAYFLKKIRLRKIKIMLFEANANPGKMISIAGRMADGVGVSYENCLKFFKNNAYLIPYPVRKEFFENYDVNPTKTKEILAIGGSQGASIINETVFRVLSKAKESDQFKIILVTGKKREFYDPLKQIEELKIKYKLKSSILDKLEIIEYLDEIVPAIKKSSLIITRGGAGALSEIKVAEVPAIILPKANLSGDHQVINAENMKALGIAKVYYEISSLKGDVFIRERDIEDLYNLINDDAQINKMKQNFTIDYSQKMNKIYDFIAKLSQGKLSEYSYEDLKEDIVYNNKFALYSAAGLINLLRRMPLEEIINSKFYHYFDYKISHLLKSAAWQIRNNGIKLIGLTKNKNYLNSLLALFKENKKISFLKRKLGGDYEQVPFIRRNIIISLVQLEEYSQEIEDLLLLGLQDKYFEVVAESLKALKFFKCRIINEKNVLAELKKIARSKNFDIQYNFILTFASFINSRADLELLEKFKFCENWKIRFALVSFYETLLLRADFNYDERDLKRDLDAMLLTTYGFIPNFTLKQKVAEVFKRVAPKA